MFADVYWYLRIEVYVGKQWDAGRQIRRENNRNPPKRLVSSAVVQFRLRIFPIHTPTKLVVEPK
jgi:hypothetical protein